jgi:hypothetical protein
MLSSHYKVLTIADAATPFQAVFGLIIFVSYITVILIVLRLNIHIDVQKLTEESNARRFARRTWFPPRDLLTETGRKRRMTAIVLFGITMCALIILTLHQHKW